MEEKFYHGVGPEPIDGGTSSKVQQNPSGSAQMIPGEAEEAAAVLRSGGSVPLCGGDSFCKQEVDFPPETGSEPQHPYEGRRTERRLGVDASSEVSWVDRSSEDKTYRSVLNQMLQQQKHKLGRRFKKKTLMKMAKLLVIAKGWGGGGDEPASHSRGQSPEGGHHEAVPPTSTGSPNTKRKPKPEPKASGSKAETEHRVSNWTSRRGQRDTSTSRVSPTPGPTESRSTLRDQTTSTVLSHDPVLSHYPVLKSSKKRGPRPRRKTQDQAPMGRTVLAACERTTRNSTRRPAAEEPEPVLSHEPASCPAGDRVDRVTAPKTQWNVNSPGPKRLPVPRQEPGGLEESNGDDAAVRVWNHGSRTQNHGARTQNHSARTQSKAERTNLIKERRRAAPKNKGPRTKANDAFKVLRGMFHLKQEADESTTENVEPEGTGRRRKMKFHVKTEPPWGSETKHLDFLCVDSRTKISLEEAARSKCTNKKPRKEKRGGPGGEEGSRGPEEHLTRCFNDQEELIVTGNTSKPKKVRAARRETAPAKRPSRKWNAPQKNLPETFPNVDAALEDVTGRRTEGAKDVQTAPGGRTPETESTLDEMKTEGEPLETKKTVTLDVGSKFVTTRTCRKRRRTSKSKTGQKRRESTDGTRGHDVDTLEDKNICQTSNVRQRRRVPLIKVEDPECPVIELKVNEEPDESSGSCQTETRTGKKRGRHRAQQMDKKDIKQPRLCPLEASSSNSSLLDKDLNLQPEWNALQKNLPETFPNLDAALEDMMGRRTEGAKDVQTAPGGQTPETESTLDEMITEGGPLETKKTVPLDVGSKSVTTRTCRKRRRTSKSKTLMGQERRESTDGTRGHDVDALEDKNICQTSNVRRRRRAPLIKVEDPECPVMELNVNEEPDESSGSCQAETRTKKKLGRRRAQQTDKKDIKQPRLCPLEASSSNSNLLDKDHNLQPEWNALQKNLPETFPNLDAALEDVTGRRTEGAKDVHTAPGGQTPETESTLDEMKTEGGPLETKKTVPLDVGSKSVTTRTCRKRRRTSKSKTLTGQERRESTDGTRGHDVDALEDKNICQTSNVRRRKRVPLIKVEDPECPVMELKVNEELDESSGSCQTETRTRKKQGRRQAQQTDKKDVKQPRLCPLEASSSNSSLLDKDLNLQPEDGNEAAQSFSSEPGASRRLGPKQRVLRCSFCRRTFRHIPALTLHKRVHTGERPYGCPVCTKRFSKRPQLLLHSKVHGKPSAVRCPCCDEAFRSKTQLILHFKVHMDEAEGSQTDLEVKGRRSSNSRSVQTFRCSVCSKEFRQSSTFAMHRQRHGINGFVVSQSNGATVVTPVVFKCPICKQLLRRWCSYVLHLQSHASGTSHRCGACGQRYDQSVETTRHCSVCCRSSGEEAACRGSLSDIWKESPKEGEAPSQPPSRTSVPPVCEDAGLCAPCPSSGLSPASGQTTRRRPGLSLPRLSGRFLCGRCGRTFTRWNQLWLHNRLHQRGGGAFRCSRCELDFHFLGLYVRHLQEHAARTPHACPSCPAAFAAEADLKTHVSMCHRQPEHLSCRTCGKRFCVRRNLRNHRQLHKGATSHTCLPCRRSFSCSAALTAHLQMHRKQLSAPRPARVHEPFVFPYRCGKCPGRFSSANLLQAHQVCHYVAGKNPESSPESFVFSDLSVCRDPSRSQRPASTKHLFRYPHPDRLYVVPIGSSEPPVVVSDTEEATKPETPGKSLQLEVLIKSLLPEKYLSDCESDTAEGTDCAAERTNCVAEHTTCAVCTLVFTDIAALHQHYKDHARGLS